MRLAAEVHTIYRCLTCGHPHDGWPDNPCCPDETTIGPGKLYTPSEIADLAQVSRSTVNAWINGGRLPALREGQVVRVRPSDWDEFASRR